MKCEHCQEWLNQYIDYELSEEESGWVEEHISVCKSCRQEYNALVRTKQACISLPEYTPPQGFTDDWKDAVLADMHPEPVRPAAAKTKTAYPAPPKRSGMQRVVRGFALAAAAVAILVVSIQAFNHFSADGNGEDIARVSESEPQASAAQDNAAGSANEQKSGLGNAPEQQLDLPEEVDIGQDTQDTPTPEFTADDETLDAAEPRSSGGMITPQGGEALDPLEAIESTELGGNDSNDANSAVNGVKEVFFSAPIDKAKIEEELEKLDVEYKFFEGMYVVEAYADNMKDVNKVLQTLGSTETVLAGETLHIRLR